jgi:tetratricopeptide (TPR) repeat protein
MKNTKATARILLLIALMAMPAWAQFQNGGQSTNLVLPLQSQKAVVSQRIGVTDITITYHRPLSKGRKIFGGVVPYGQVWRAGANENTTIEFTDPVTVEGKALDAGTYGLHMIPNEDHWTVIFSKVSTAWGSFTYDQKEDALRVDVKPQTASEQDALSYEFDHLQPTSAVATLRWEKVAVPFQIAVDVDKIAVDSLHKQLRGLIRYTWDSWDDAATFMLENNLDLNEALKDSEQSIQTEERFENYMTKSRILAAMHRDQEADAAMKQSLALASPLQMHIYARTLQAQKKPEAAFAIFRMNAEKHPEKWFVHNGMARVYSSEGKFDDAVKEMQIAYDGAPEGTKPFLQGLVKKLQAKQDIN